MNDEFDALAEVLSSGILASCLLGVDQVTRETERQIEFSDPVTLSFDVKPEEAIDYFKKKQIVTRKAFDKLADDARAGAFTVSGVYKKQVIGGFKDEIINALEFGTPQRETINRFKDILQGAGHRQLGDFHLETVFRTNMQMGYGVGRRRALESTVEDFPFWQYHAVMDDRVRPTHAALNNMILPATSPFWTDHFPPWDFNCRCSVTATDELPDGYNAANPSGEDGTTIFYDDKGKPAKAEIGTRVYDLDADSKFQGAPPQKDLKEVIQAAAERAEEKATLNANAGKRIGQKPPRVTKTGEKEPLEVALERVEKQIARRKTEKAVLLDTDGRIILESSQRAAGEVSFEVPDEGLFGKTLTHNHPNSVSFSKEDIEIAATHQLAEIRTVGRRYRHSMRPPDSGWSKVFWQEVVQPVYERIAGILERFFSARKKRGMITEEEFDLELYHQIWVEVAKRTGLKYERKKW